MVALAVAWGVVVLLVLLYTFVSEHHFTTAMDALVKTLLVFLALAAATVLFVSGYLAAQVYADAP